MEIGISTACLFSKCNLEDSFEIIKATGARKVEVFLNSPSEYEEDFAHLIRERLDKNGLEAYSVHPLGSQFESQLFSIHNRQREDALSVFRKVLRAGKIIGATCYVMHGAAHLSGVAKNLQDGRVVETIAELIEIAKEYRITLALENVSWCIYHCPEYGKMLQKGIGGHRLKFVLDVKQAVRCGVSPFDLIATIGEDIVNVHLCDYSIKQGKLLLKMPGEGEFDFYRLMLALKSKGYEGLAFIEVYSDMFDRYEQLNRAYEFLQKTVFTSERKYGSISYQARRAKR